MPESSIVEEARALLPLIRDERPEGELRARLTKNVVEACGRAGLFRATGATEAGGLECRLSDIVAASEIVSGADPAVGWYVQNSMQAWRMASQLDPDTRAEVFTDPNRYCANAGQNQGVVTRVDGGYRLSGTWPVVTGVEDSDWAFMVGTMFEKGEPRLIEDRPDTRNLLVPTSALEISQTWQGVSAMRGTGSNRVRVDDVFVPDRFAVSGETPLVIDRAYTRLSPLAWIMPSIGGVVLGVLGSVIETLADALGAHTAAFTGEARRDQAASQELAVRCRAEYRALRAGLYDVVGAIDAALESGGDVLADLRAEAYASSMYTVDMSRKLASDIFAGGTRDAFLRDNPMERGLKDLHAIGYIMASARFIVHTAGRVMLGGEPDPGA
jgi:alkylation response protein AidB-like acyl-CoA dehydrogenase